MSDDRNEADDKADAMGKPMANPKVDVKVKPVQTGKMPAIGHPDRKKAEENDEANRRIAKKVKENVTEKAKDAARKAGEKPGASRQDQYDAAKKAANDESVSIPRHRVKEFTVTVGDEYEKKTSTHVPQDGGPLPNKVSDAPSDD